MREKEKKICLLPQIHMSYCEATGAVGMYIRLPRDRCSPAEGLFDEEEPSRVSGVHI